MLRLSFIATLMLAITACSTTSSNTQSPSSSGASVEIRFKGHPGKSYETRYFSTSRILTYSDSQLVKDRTEAVDFTVKSEIKSYDAGAQTIGFSSTTINKDGVVPLHDLAFPEKGEVIDFIVKSTGEVLKAGEYPPQSIFYVPAMPIPKHKVQIGDTWPLEFVWASARDGIPLKLEVVGILKDIKSCNGGNKCADVEISGHVHLVINPDAVNAKFESRIWGRMLFDLDRGDVTWSQTRSREEMTTKTDRVLVSSCMISETKSEKGYRSKIECEPKEEAINNTPNL